MEEFDKGGTGDYTKEKYEQPDYTMQEILVLKEDASSCNTDSMPDPNRADILSVCVAQGTAGRIKKNGKRDKCGDRRQRP